MLTAKADEIDRIPIGFEVGADDYVTKPFSPRELVLRIKNILRRGRLVSDKQPSVIELKDVAADPERHEVTYRGKSTAQRSPNSNSYSSWLVAKVVSKSAKVARGCLGIRGGRFHSNCRHSRTASTEEAYAASEYIETVRGVGYRLLEIRSKLACKNLGCT